jgi:hypothetical protein
MPEIATIGLDIAKNVFQLHGVDRRVLSQIRNRGEKAAEAPCCPYAASR